MSPRINQLISVLTIIANNPTSIESRNSLTQNRIEAIRIIGERDGILSTTVSNKFRRNLGFNGTTEFDEACYQWLVNNSRELERHMIEHAVDDDDNDAIRDFFNTYSV